MNTVAGITGIVYYKEQAEQNSHRKKNWPRNLFNQIYQHHLMGTMYQRAMDVLGYRSGGNLRTVDFREAIPLDITTTKSSEGLVTIA